MPLIKARSSSIMDSVDLRGQPTSETAAQTVNNNQLASTAYVRTALANLIDSSPELLDTLNELAQAIGNDENFATTVANSIATKVALDGSTPMTGELTLSGTPTQDLSAATKKYVDDLVDAQMIYSTDDVDEGTTNLYYTAARVKQTISLTSDNTTVLSYDQTNGAFTYNHPTSDGVLEGSTNQYFTQSRARNSITMNSDDGTIISYSGITGEITFTTPDTDKIVEGSTNLYFTTSRARASVSNGSNIAYDSGTGVISTQAAVWTVNGQEHDVVLDTDNIDEGSTNLYFTEARGRGAVSLTTDDTNILSYSSATGTFTFVTPSTDSIDEGSTNQYFTQARARGSVSVANGAGGGGSTSYSFDSAADWTYANFGNTNPVTQIDFGDTPGALHDLLAAGGIPIGTQITTSGMGAGVVETTSAFTLTGGVWSASVNVVSGPPFGAILGVSFTVAGGSSGGTSLLSYDDSTGVFTLAEITTDDVTEGDNLYYTDTRVRSAITLTSDNTDVLSYDSSTGAFTFSLGDQTTDDVAEGSTNLYYTDARARSSVSVDGWSNLSYNSSTGVITVSAPSTADVSENPSYLYFTDTRARNAVSATQTSGDGNFSYDNTTGVFTFVGSDDADYRGAVSAYRDSGDGDLQYDSQTGVFTYTGPSASETRVHFSATTSGTGFGGLSYNDATGVFTYAKVTSADVRGELSATTSGTGFGNLTYDSATGAYTYAKVTSADVRGELSATTASGVTYDSATGVIALASIPNSSLANSDVTVNGYAISLGGSHTLNADDIAEAVGGTNKYFTEARFDTSLAGKTTDDVAEGDNLYYTQARFDTAFGDKSTTDLAEGTNEYFTEARARNSLVAGTGVTYTSSTGTIAIGQAVGTTDNVTFNDVTVSGDLTVNGTLTTINSTDLTVTDKNITIAEGAANAAAANGAGITIDGADAQFFYSSGDDSWNVNKSVNVTGGVSVTSTITSTQGFIGDLTGDVTGDVTGDLFGNADTATALQTARNIQGVAFDGTANITVVTAGTGVTVTGTEVKIGQAVGTTDSVTFNTVTADLTGDVTGNVLGNVTGTVSDISNHTTDTLTEGTTNLYATAARVRQALSASDEGGDGSFSYDDSTGVFSYTGPSASETRAHFSATTSGTGHGGLSYNSTTGAFTFAKVTASNIRGELSANKVSGDGNFSYDSATGVFSYTGPSAGDTRAHFSADISTGASYDQSTGVFSLANIPNASLSYSDITVNGYTIALGGSQTLDTDDIGEGATNEYFTQTRARSAISLTTSDSTVLSYDSATGAFDFDLSGINSDEVTEGTTNLYFTQTRARASISTNGWSNLSYNDSTGVISISAPSTADVTEDASNLYYTDARARSAISLTTNNSDALSYDSATGVFTFALNTVDSDEIAEGSTNLYFTTSRARNSISNGSNIDYDAATGIISTQAAVWSVNTQTGDVVLDTDNIDEGSANLYFTDARARSAITLTTDDSNILAYNTGTGALTFVTPTTDSIEEGAVNLYYTDTRADDRIAAASIRDLSDVDAEEVLQDGYTLVWNSFLGKFVPQNVAVQAVTKNFTGDGTATSFNTEVEVTSIDNTSVFINGLIQAPTYSYTISTTDGETSIVFDTAPEANDYIFVRVSAANTLSAGGVLNEGSTIDGGTY